MSNISIREENLNVMLAELLVESGLRAIGEVVIKHRMPDVLVDLSGIRMVIEGKYPGNRKTLREQAIKRIDEGICDIVVMVEYVKLPLPSSLYITQKEIKEALRSGRFNVGFMTYIERIGIEKWISLKKRYKSEFYEDVDFRDLLAHILSVYDYVVSEDIIKPVVEKLENSVFKFAENVLSARVNVDRVKRALELGEGAEQYEPE